jgi:hypothetical protein
VRIPHGIFSLIGSYDVTEFPPVVGASGVKKIPLLLLLSSCYIALSILNFPISSLPSSLRFVGRERPCSQLSI